MQTEHQHRTIGRAAEDFQQKLLGRQPLRFTFEVIPQSVDGLPSSAETVSVVWEKGAKLSYTDPSPVNADGQAHFSQVMRQTATMYKQDNLLLPKEYTFKVQTVRQGSNRLLSSSETRRKTIARAKLNLADYCTPGAAAPATAEVALPLQPQGNLKLAIRAVWLQHSSKGNAKLDRASEQGSITDISSHYSSETDSDGDGVNRTASLDLDQLADCPSIHARQKTSLSEAMTVDRTGRGWNRDAVKGVTTDELMRQIAAADDVGKLQQLCKGLLCERNDWRYKATQLDRNVKAMQLQMEKMQVANTNLLQQLERVEAQVSQLQQDTLVDKLVDAKLQLAQADLQATALRGQLTKERERSRQWAAKFTDLEVLYESLLEQEATRQGSSYIPGTTAPHTPDGPLTKRLYIDVGAAADASTPSGEQGEGLSGAAAAAGTVASGLVRKFSNTGWGGLGGLMRSGASLVAAAPAMGPEQELPSSRRRASTPSGEASVTNETGQVGLQQRSARHSIA
eukprot:gene9941-10096_t